MDQTILSPSDQENSNNKLVLHPEFPTTFVSSSITIFLAPTIVNQEPEGPKPLMQCLHRDTLPGRTIKERKTKNET